MRLKCAIEGFGFQSHIFFEKFFYYDVIRVSDMFGFAIENAIEEKLFNRIIAFYLCDVERHKYYLFSH